MKRKSETNLIQHDWLEYRNNCGNFTFLGRTRLTTHEIKLCFRGFVWGISVLQTYYQANLHGRASVELFRLHLISMIYFRTAVQVLEGIHIIRRNKMNKKKLTNISRIKLKYQKYRMEILRIISFLYILEIMFRWHIFRYNFDICHF